MTVLLILFALWVLIAVAQWRGWTADTRDGLDWASRAEAQRRGLHS
jgi:sugar phosphate permease